MKALSLPLEPLLLQCLARDDADDCSPAPPSLTGEFLRRAGDAELIAHLHGQFRGRFSLEVLLPWVAASIRWVRFGLEHLIHGADSPGRRLARCLQPGEAYHVAGLGLEFWSHLGHLVAPDAWPRWSRLAERGLARLGLLGPPTPDPARRYSRYQATLGKLHDRLPHAPPFDWFDFLERVAVMRGRDLPASTAGETIDLEFLRDRLRQVRTALPLRARLRQSRGAPPPEPCSELARRAWGLIGDGFENATDDAPTRAALKVLLPPLLERLRIHPLECEDLWRRVIERAPLGEPPCRGGRFLGLARDGVRFLQELERHNDSAWMTAQKARYHFAVREPLRELAIHLTERYLEPVLVRGLGWSLETQPRTGRVLSSIGKNDHGQSVPYQTCMWLTFYRAQPGGRREEVQWFAVLEPAGLRFGFRLGPAARAAGQRLRQAVQQHGELLFQNLRRSQAVEECRWRHEEGGEPVTLRHPEDLRAWAAGKTLLAERQIPHDSPRLVSDELVGEILLCWDRLLPLFYACVEESPAAWLGQRLGSLGGAAPFDRERFRRESLLPAGWLDRAMELLQLKKQLILHGVPGTGKTHVAKLLARLLTHDRPDHVRMVQFHASYAYEEFVEGIRARSVEAQGRTQVTYPVEGGLLLEFAAKAQERPHEPFVLIIDEINRGNLPRIFGELLYLLEYRQQEISLPYSRRPFRLPENLILLATMNGADRSIAHLDQALRRRFSFLEMEPDPRVLAQWLERHPSPAGEAFLQQVVRLFEALNERLRRDAGPQAQLGHSYFMLPRLDRDRLQVVWEHHVLPHLREALGAQPQRLQELDLDRLLGHRKRPTPDPS